VHSTVHRAARADFNVRAGQGRQASYSAGGLVFSTGRIGPKNPAHLSSQAGDLCFAEVAC
jgi:hypothetical protein